MRTVGDIELAWTVVGALGLLVSFWNLIDAVVDWRVIRIGGVNGAARLAAGFQVWMESGRVLLNAIVVYFGIYAMTQVEAPALPWTTFRIILTVMLFLIPVVLASQSIVGRWFRHRLAMEVTKEEHRGR